MCRIPGNPCLQKKRRALPYMFVHVCTIMYRSPHAHSTHTMCYSGWSQIYCRSSRSSSNKCGHNVDRERQEWHLMAQGGREHEKWSLRSTEGQTRWSVCVHTRTRASSTCSVQEWEKTHFFRAIIQVSVHGSSLSLTSPGWSIESKSASH